MPPNLIIVLGSLGESTFTFLDEAQKVQLSKKAAAKELFEKAIVEEPFAKADEKVPSEEKAPFPQEKYTQSILIALEKEVRKLWVNQKLLFSGVANLHQSLNYLIDRFLQNEEWLQNKVRP